MGASHARNGLHVQRRDGPQQGPQLWYGDLIYADRNGDGNYGDDNDMDFNGRTSTPSYNLGVNLGFAWKGLDFNMTWSGAFDYYIIWNALYYNGTQTTNGHGISERVADNHYFFDPENPADARTNLKGAYPRLTFALPATTVGQRDSTNTMATT